MSKSLDSLSLKIFNSIRIFMDYCLCSIIFYMVLLGQQNLTSLLKLFICFNEKEVNE